MGGEQTNIEEERKVDGSLVHLEPGEPGTHVLLVGIGHYPHLPGGGAAPTQNDDGMGQLGCPPTSARAMADWFVRSYDNPARPLASLSLLLSEPTPAVYRHPLSGVGLPVPSGTADEVQSAIRAWIRRSASDPGNLTVFYFCGHGLSQGLLEAAILRDYGAEPHAAFDGALDLAALKNAMENAVPSAQIFLIDSCRVASGQFDPGMRSVGRSVVQIGPKTRLSLGPVSQSVHYATFASLEAYGADDDVSVYAKALLRALNSAARQDGRGDWWVDTGDLQRQVEATTRRIAAEGGRDQRPETMRFSTIPLTRLRAEPRLPVLVSCEPGEAIGAALLSCHLDELLVGEHDGPAQPDVLHWLTDLHVGRYEFRAHFPDGSHALASHMRHVMPPLTEIVLPVTRSKQQA